MKAKILNASARAAVLFAFLMCGPIGLQAQLAVTTATLSGSVTDPSGAVVPQAVVKLTSTLNGVNRTYTTDATGRFTFPQLAPSTYTLSIAAKGFEAYQQTGISLDPGQSATQNVALVIGSMSPGDTRQRSGFSAQHRQRQRLGGH